MSILINPIDQEVANVELLIMQYLDGKLAEHDLQAYVEVPEHRPDRFVTIERTGGSIDSYVIDRPMIAIQCWGTTRYDAFEQANLIDKYMRQIPQFVDPITKITRDTIYNFPDSKTGQNRYQIVYNLVTIT